MHLNCIYLPHIQLQGWLNVEVLLPPNITKLTDGYYFELESQFCHYYFINVGNSKSIRVQRPQDFTFSWLWRKTWIFPPKPELMQVHNWVTSLKWPGQKWHGGIRTGVGSVVKDTLIPLTIKEISSGEKNHQYVLPAHENM